MIQVYLSEQPKQLVKRDGIRDLLRLFFGAARFYEAEPGLLVYEADTDYLLVCGFTEDFAFSYQAYEHETREALNELIFCSSERSERAGLILALDSEDNMKLRQRKLKRCVYNCLSAMSGKVFPWGSLSGIRPSYLAAEYLQERMTEEETTRALVDNYALKIEKAALATEVAMAERAILARQNPHALHLYIHVPFCRTRCSYCSFTYPEAVNPGEHDLENYLEALLKELEAVLHDLHCPINSLYIGGGTPGILTTQQLGSLFTKLRQCVDLENCPEISFEAGRSDSLDIEKLTLLKRCGVTRLCINPQSMQLKTLLRIARPETPERIKETFQLAKNIGFQSVNMDLIAGLGDETLSDFSDSLEQVLALAPENITIHSLARKQNSDLDVVMKSAEQKQNQIQQDANKLLKNLGDPSQALEQMLQTAYERLVRANYRPYYLYRHKDGLGGLENLAYARPGHACVYNVCMMTDARSVVAFGASAISKRVSQERTERFPNQRKPYEYIRKLDEQIEKKRKIFDKYYKNEEN